MNVNYQWATENWKEGVDGIRIVGIFHGEENNENQLLNKIVNKHPLWGHEGKIHFFSFDDTQELVILGLGKKEKWTIKKAERLGAKLQRFLVKEGVEKAFLYWDSIFYEHEENKYITSFATGMTLASYNVKTYKTDAVPRSKNFSLQLFTEKKQAEKEAAFDKGYEKGKATNEARRLVNTPANLMTPSILADEAIKLGEELNVGVDVFSEEKINSLGMGALLAVARGSEEPPRFITIKYYGNPGADGWDVALVGKGLTYDSGGYSLKTREGMKTMKMDMGGAAATLGAMRIILHERPRINVMAVIPSTENLVNGKALKPGDVIQSLSGKTIEVLNTDAEGRLILADAITYAKREGARALIDVATLTGAAVVALGDVVTGAVTNDESFIATVNEAAEQAGERVWTFPNDEAYREKVRQSDVADLNNSPGRQAGAITAGLFIGEFAGDTPWVHLDIAGTGWQERSNILGPRGGTGAMVRTVAETVSLMAKK